MKKKEEEPEPKSPEIDLEKVPSPVLKRLIEEVRNEESDERSRYNRFHNRHNRSR